LANYVTHLQPEIRVNYCRLLTVSVDNRYDLNDMRDRLAAEWPFLMDVERKLLYELGMVDTTDTSHGDIYIPTTFILNGDRAIYKIYSGWWFLGRPTVEELRLDLRALMSQRPDWVYDPDFREKRQTLNLPKPIPQHLTE